MSKVELEIAETTPCFYCHEPMPLTESECAACQKEVPLRLTILDFLGDFFGGHIIDARAGGLVVGRHDSEEDIPMLIGVGLGVLQISGMMQGGEYVVNREAASKHADRIQEINSYKNKQYKPVESIDITARTRIFNTNGLQGKLLIFLDSGQFIVNRAATIKYYLELEEINNSVVHEDSPLSGYSPPKGSIMAEPNCPKCGTHGLDKIVSSGSSEESKGGDPWFNVVHCSECGHVYGVFAKHVISHEIKPIMPRINF
jgi:hypothetical protein